jgi:transcriptional regulator with XRE-family HTH domain
MDTQVACSRHNLIEHFATEAKPFHFTESGLDNVYLVGIKYFTCDCGKVSAEIPALKQLMRLIAKGIVFSQDSLGGNEVRFLRKRMGTKSMDMAKRLRIDDSTFSRIENGHQQAGPQIDLLMRMVYCVVSEDVDLLAHCKAIIQALQDEIHRRTKAKIITMKISSDHEWSDLKEAA